MLCEVCSKLASMPSNRICLRCKGIISNNLSVICDNCSNQERLCAMCLKKLYSISKINRPQSNCSHCGGGK